MRPATRSLTMAPAAPDLADPGSSVMLGHRGSSGALQHSVPYCGGGVGNNVHGANGKTNQLAGQGGIEETCDLAVGWTADNDHAGMPLVGVFGDPAPSASVIAENTQQVTVCGDPCRSQTVEGLGYDDPGLVRGLDIDGELLDDVALHHVNDVDGTVEQPGELGGGIGDCRHVRVRIDRSHNGRAPVERVQPGCLGRRGGPVECGFERGTRHRCGNW